MDSIIINPKRYHLIKQIQESLAEGCSKREVARRLGIGRHTVSKYAEGDPRILSELGVRSNKLASYLEDCLSCLNDGFSKKETIDSLAQCGCHVPQRTIYDYFIKIESAAQKEFSPHGYAKYLSKAQSPRKGSKGRYADFVTREGTFRFI